MARDTRQRMIETTRSLLQRQGFHATGLNQILTEAGAPKGSMYFHFPGGKEELAAAAIASGGAYVDAALAAHDRGDTLASLDAYLAAVSLGLERSDFADGCPIATTALEVGPTSEAIAAACRAALELWTARVATWLEADGVPEKEARDRARLIYAAIEGALVFTKAHGSTQPLDDLRGQLPLLLGQSTRPNADPPDRSAPTDSAERRTNGAARTMRDRAARRS